MFKKTHKKLSFTIFTYLKYLCILMRKPLNQNFQSGVSTQIAPLYHPDTLVNPDT